MTEDKNILLEENAGMSEAYKRFWEEIDKRLKEFWNENII